MAIETEMSSDRAVRQPKSSSNGRDTHAMPPQHIHNVYRKYQKMSDQDVYRDHEIVDFSRGLSVDQQQKLSVVESIPTATAKMVFRAFLGDEEQPETELAPRPVYEHGEFPGLRLFPGLLSPAVQIAFVDRLLHRDLSNPLHKTNLHDDYILPDVCEAASSASSQTASFFTLPTSDSSSMLLPKDSKGRHQPLNLAQFLNRRWRYLTLGSQYDWATRLYPPRDEVVTSFPPDMADLVSGFFPQVRAESGVVLIYSPKDFMPVHRDVSEMCERELCSFSLGCDGLFVIALDDRRLDAYSDKLESGQVEEDDHDRPLKTVTIRVRSGDMIQMSGPVRWAWHAMPKVLGGTCPEFLRDWPVRPRTQSKEEIKLYEKWRGFMNTKRINISCRQVYD